MNFNLVVATIWVNVERRVDHAIGDAADKDAVWVGVAVASQIDNEEGIIELAIQEVTKQ